MNGTVNSLEKFAIEFQSRPLSLLIIESTLFAILQFLAITGNALTLYVIWKTPNLRTIPNYFVACLAVSDLGMGVLTEHLLLGALVTSRWPFGDAACQYQGVVSITMATASVQIMTWIAINRYFKIVNSKYFSRLFTRKKTVGIFVFIWSSCLLSTAPYLLAGRKFFFHPAKFFCYYTLNIEWYNAFLGTFYFGIPTLIAVVCYWKVFKTTRKHTGQVTNFQEIRVTRTLFLIIVVFMGFWAPVVVMDTIDTVCGDYILPRQAYVFATFMATCSYSVNPFIYGFSNSSFKKEYLKILKCRSRVTVEPQPTFEMKNRL